LEITFASFYLENIDSNVEHLISHPATSFNNSLYTFPKEITLKNDSGKTSTGLRVERKLLCVIKD
jgi:hypothetical protein